MRYVVYGAGAIGTLIGARLALSGNEVSFLARPRRATEFQQFGLNLAGDTPPASLPNPTVFTRLEEVGSKSTPEVVLLTVKAFDIQSAGEDILRFLPSDVPVICFANGINNEKTLSEILGSNRVIHATITTAVQLFPQGIIQVERERGIGFSGTHPLLPDIINDFSGTNMIVRRFAVPERMKWSKALTNIVSNASSAILGWNPAQVYGHPGLFRLEVEALRETVRVMAKKGMRPQNLPGVPLSLLGFGVFLPTFLIQIPLGRIVAQGRGEKRPSFHFDIGTGRSEVAWLNGAIAAAGRKLNVNCPANQVLFETMMSLVDRAEEQERYLGEPIELLRLGAIAGVPGIQGYNPSRK
jgi:2-dehydropantoate 2-reductase